MLKIDEINCYKSTFELFYRLQEAEKRAEKEGWIDADDLEKEVEE